MSSAVVSEYKATTMTGMYSKIIFNIDIDLSKVTRLEQNQNMLVGKAMIYLKKKPIKFTKYFVSRMFELRCRYYT